MRCGSFASISVYSRRVRFPLHSDQKVDILDVGFVPISLKKSVFTTDLIAALIAWFGSLGFDLVRIGIEAGICTGAGPRIMSHCL